MALGYSEKIPPLDGEVRHCILTPAGHALANRHNTETPIIIEGPGGLLLYSPNVETIPAEQL